MTEMTLGHIPYLNCVPFFNYLREAGFDGDLVSGVPSALNQMLQQGTLDVSPSSSFEYARHWRDYLLLPGHSISSIGAVHSVLLFSPIDIGALEGETIAITGESATSINLLRIILREFYGLVAVRDSVPNEPVETSIDQRRPALLIGDRALRMAAKPPAGMQVFDLGELWYQHTGLPFVFALWMVRRASLDRFRGELSRLSGQLQQSCERVLASPQELARQSAKTCNLPAAEIVAYWRTIDYRLEEAHLQGLSLFFELCVKHKLLTQSPPIEFMQLSEPLMVD